MKNAEALGGVSISRLRLYGNDATATPSRFKHGGNEPHGHRFANVFRGHRAAHGAFGSPSCLEILPLPTVYGVYILYL